MTGSANNLAEREDGCFCSAVGFRAVPESLEVGVCHCSMCRRWGGSVFMSVEVFADWKETGKISPDVYESSAWAQRRFCPEYDTSIGWQTHDGLNTMLAAPVFDDEDGFVFSSEIFVDKKPEFYEFSNDTKKFTEADVLAHFSEKRS